MNSALVNLENRAEKVAFPCGLFIATHVKIKHKISWDKSHFTENQGSNKLLQHSKLLTFIN